MKKSRCILLLTTVGVVGAVDYDVVVYGSTPAGCAAASVAAELGMRVALYEPLKKAGAVFRDVSGWECADWFVPPTATPEGPDPDPIGPLSFGKHKWFDHWRDEHLDWRDHQLLLKAAIAALKQKQEL